MRRVSRWLNVSGAGIVLACGLWVIQAQPKQNPNFTGGTVTPIDDKEGAIAHFRFEPGARTKWHSHERGQIILVEEGVGRTQVKGGPVIELHAGETTYAGPGVIHWHGAAPDKGGVQYNISRGGITWLEAVTDQEFNAPPKRK
jgi:quercetin dioxygenase-like cupin family protein